MSSSTSAAQRRDKLIEIAISLSSTLDMEELFFQIVSAVQEIMECDGASILLCEGEELYFAKISNTEVWDALKNVRLKLGEGIAGFVAATGEASIVNNAQAEARHSPKGDQSTGMVTRTMLTVPMRSRGRTVGVLQAINRHSGPFTEEEIPICTALANLAAVATENALLHQHMQAMVQAKTRIVTLLSHELRTPLACIQGAVECLEPDADPELLAEMAGMIRTEADNMGRLLEDLFLASELDKVEPEKGPGLREPVDLASLFQARLDRLREAHDAHEFRLDVLSAGRPSKVAGDRAKLEQCVRHLLDNAVKFSPEGGLVRVALLDRGSEVVAQVRDEGIGIPEDRQEAIFDRFYQVDQADNRAFEGLGLGLYLCREVVGRLGGTLTVASQPGQGSTFTMTLPAA